MNFCSDGAMRRDIPTDRHQTSLSREIDTPSTFAHPICGNLETASKPGLYRLVTI
jgi:hypothetical protein